ncbi:hypothetical protein IAR55_004704 [Kwoniella newhampshirensis]|uniref:N-acetyltransferase domain-containing protein n=1 Tax=Kwoniella newhampshirensis TaxID=1651941 RepID=A0AAW0YHS7_9TREE
MTVVQTASAIDPAGLTLVPATPEQAVQVRTNTLDWFCKWDKLTPEEWSYHDETLVDDPDTGLKHKRIVVWLLVSRSTLLPTSPVTSSASLSEIYSHFETYRMPGLLFSPSSSSASAQNVAIYGIGTVWTPVEHRRKGYARLALQLGHYVLGKTRSLPSFPTIWGQPPPITLGDATASVLYSDVGPKYYQSCTIGEHLDGWKEQGSTITEWYLHDGSKEGENGGRGLDAWEWVTSLRTVKELEKLVIEDTRRRLASETDKDRTKIALVPTGDVLSAHHNRLLLRDPFPSDAAPVRPTAFAAYNRDTSSLVVFCPQNGKAIYHPHEYKGKTLEISHVVGQVPWQVVGQAAKREGCRRIEAWGPEAASKGWPKGIVRERGDLYGMMAYYDKLQSGEEQPLWVGNGIWTPCRTWNFGKALAARDYAKQWL